MKLHRRSDAEIPRNPPVSHGERPGDALRGHKWPGLAKRTVSRHLRTLEKADNVTQYDDEYYLGQLYLDYGIHARRRHPLYHAAKPKIDALAEEVGEKVRCAVEENGDVVHLYFRSGGELYRSCTRLGYGGHLHAFPSGKAILAHLSPERVDDSGKGGRRSFPVYPGR